MGSNLATTKTDFSSSNSKHEKLESKKQRAGEGRAPYLGPSCEKVLEPRTKTRSSGFPHDSSTTPTRKEGLGGGEGR